MIKITEAVQRLADEQFVIIVSHLVDVHRLANKIIAAHGGWEE